MIYFQRNTKRVFVRVDLFEEGPTSLWFLRDFEGEVEARIAANALRLRLESVVETAVREAYEHGWNDHKQRKRKATRFSGYLQSKLRAWHA